MRKTLFIIVSSLAGVASQFNCNAGCSLDSSVMGPPVCDENEFTFANACVAYCQGFTKYTYGSCGQGNDESRISAFDVSGSSEVITMDVMNRFAQENFRFVTKRTKFASQLDDYENIVESDLVEPIDMPQRRLFVRLTSDGNEYMAPMDSSSSSGIPSSSSGYEGLAGKENRKLLRDRNLLVLGADARSIIADTTVLPYRAIGSADFTTGKSACTVTMISRTSALTAGHCVWRKSTNEQQPMLSVSPGRYVDALSGSIIEPFGSWDVDYVSTFPEFKDFGDEAFDMAVVTYKPANRPDLGCSQVYPGDVVGWLGIEKVSGTGSAVNDARLATITVTGYPSDFQQGQMVTSNACSRAALSGGPQYVWHFCDTAAGMSGSALLTSSNVVLGNHAHGNWVTSRNGGPVLTSKLYDAVYSWAGLRNQQAFVCTTSTACPCSSATNPSQRALCWFINFKGCFRSALESANRT